LKPKWRISYQKKYLDNNIFENLDEDEKLECAAFSSENYFRNAAQQMFKATLKLEIEEFLQRLKYAKTSPVEFCGSRFGYHQLWMILTAENGLKVCVPRVSDNA
jgi:hypothetical protein